MCPNNQISSLAFTLELWITGKTEQNRLLFVEELVRLVGTNEEIVHVLISTPLPLDLELVNAGWQVVLARMLVGKLFW